MRRTRQQVGYLSRFGRPGIDIEGTQREEETDLGNIAGGMATAAFFGLTAYSTMALYTNRQILKQYTGGIREFLQRRLPWEFSAEARARSRVAGPSSAPAKSIMDMVRRNQDLPGLRESQEMLGQSIRAEVKEIEEYLRATPEGQMYLDHASGEFFSSNYVVDPPIYEAAADPFRVNYSRKYRNALRKYRRAYDVTQTHIRRGDALTDIPRSPDIVLEAHRKAIERLTLRGEPTEFDFGQVRYRPIDVNASAYTNRKGIVSLQGMLKDAESKGILKWRDRDLFSKLPGYANLKMAQMDTEVASLYRKLRAELSSAAVNDLRVGSTTPIDSLYSITPELVDLGRGDMAIKFTMQLTRESTSEVVSGRLTVPLGNKHTIRLGGQGINMVGATRWTGQDWATPAAQYSRMMGEQAGRIVGTMGTPQFERTVSRINASMARRVTTSKGTLVDLHDSLSLYMPEGARISPMYRWEPGEREALEEELLQRRRELVDYRHLTPNVRKATQTAERIEQIKRELGTRYDVSQRLLMLRDWMTNMSEEPGVPGIHRATFHEHSGIHAGALHLRTSIFGESPLAVEATPQASLQQFWNVYEMKGGVKGSFPIRWGTSTLVSPLARRNYTYARTFVAGSLYPLSESTTYARTDYFWRLMGMKARETGEETVIRIPIRTGRFQIASSQPGLKKIAGQIEQILRDNGGVISQWEIDGVIDSSTTYIPKGSMITSEGGGRGIASGEFNRMVTGGSFETTGEGKQLVLRLARTDYATMRLRTPGTNVRGVVQPMRIDIREGTMRPGPPVDLVTSGSIAKRMSINTIHTLMIVDAVKNTQWTNDQLKRIVTDIKATSYQKRQAQLMITSNIYRLRKAANLLGVQYNTTTNSIDLPSAIASPYKTFSVQQVGEILTTLHKVYDPKSPEFHQIKAQWDKFGPATFDILGLPRDAAALYAPRARGPAFLSLWDRGPEGPVLGFTLGDEVGIMRQTHEEMLKIVGMQVGADAGFPVRLTELQYLTDRVMGLPPSAREEMLKHVERYTAYIAKQMNAEEVSSEYKNLLYQALFQDSATEIAERDIIRRGTPRYQEFMEELRKTRAFGIGTIPTETAYLFEDGTVVGGDEALARISEAAKAGQTYTAIPAYQLKPEDLGVLDPQKGFLNKWIQLPDDIEYEYAGKTARTDLLRLSHPMSFKNQPIPMQAADGTRIFVPGHYASVLNALLMSSEHGSFPFKQFVTRDLTTLRPNKVMALDIEVLTRANQGFPDAKFNPIIAVGMKTLGRGRQFTQTITPQDLASPVKGDRALLQYMVDTLKREKPDVLVTYNGTVFDIPYIIDRMRHHKMDPTVLNQGGSIQHWDLYASVMEDPRFKGLPNRGLKDIAKQLKFQGVTQLTEKQMNNTVSLVGSDALKRYIESDIEVSAKLADYYIQSGYPPSAVPNTAFVARDARNWLDKAMDMFWVGKRSALRTSAMTAYMPGIQAVAVPISKAPLQGIHGKVDLSRYGPMDIVVSASHFNDLEELIKQNLIQKYTHHLTGELDIAGMKRELMALRTGKTWWPVTTGRHPVTGPMARAGARLFFEPQLVGSGLEGMKYIGVGLQFGTWGDFDFDIYQTLIAADWEPTKSVEAVLTSGLKAEPGEFRPMGWRAYQGTPEFKYMIGRDDWNSKGFSEEYSRAILGTTATPVAKPTGGFEEFRIPKVYRLVKTDDGVGAFIEVQKVFTTPEGEKYVSGEWERVLDPVTRQPVRWMPSAWAEATEKLVETGKELDPDLAQMWKVLPPKERLRLLSNARFTKSYESSRAAMVDQYMAQVMQKGMVGHATSYSWAMGILAGKYMPPREAAAWRTAMADWVQKVLQAKKLSKEGIEKQLTGFGSFTRLMRGVETLEDHFAKGLVSSAEEGGWSVPRDALAEFIKSVPKAERARFFPDAGITYEMLYRATDRYNAEELVKMLSEARGVSQSEYLLGDTLQLGGFKRLLEQISEHRKDDIVPNALRMGGGNTGYFKRKPFLGPIMKPGHVENTVLADLIGKNQAAQTKGLLVGAGVLAGLYMAFNFFKRDQMTTLDVMPGYGGEKWTPWAGRQMELPYNVPIDVPSYTWNAPPYQRKPSFFNPFGAKRARVEMYNPRTEEKEEEARSRVRLMFGPSQDWNLATTATSVYNNYSPSDLPFSTMGAQRGSSFM